MVDFFDMFGAEDCSVEKNGIVLHLFHLGILETNCYLLHNGSEAIVIDPGGEPSKLVEYIRKNNLRLTAIFNTHLHFDHTFGNAELARQTGASVFAGKEDEALLQTGVGNGSLVRLSIEPFSYEPLVAGEYEFLGMPCTVFSTPGHSPGSKSMYFLTLEWVFVGDLIFYRSVGRTDFEGGDSDILQKSVKEKILSLPPDTVIFSGHGPQTEVGFEAVNNPFLV